jgi:hypothetical protein
MAVAAATMIQERADPPMPDAIKKAKSQSARVRMIILVWTAWVLVLVAYLGIVWVH